MLRKQFIALIKIVVLCKFFGSSPMLFFDETRNKIINVTRNPLIKFWQSRGELHEIDVMVNNNIFHKRVELRKGFLCVWGLGSERENASFPLFLYNINAAFLRKYYIVIQCTYGIMIFYFKGLRITITQNGMIISWNSVRKIFREYWNDA